MGKDLIFEAILVTTKYTENSKRIINANTKISTSVDKIGKKSVVFKNLSEEARKAGNAVGTAANNVARLDKAISKVNSRKLLNLNDKLNQQNVKASNQKQVGRVNASSLIGNQRVADFNKVQAAKINAANVIIQSRVSGSNAQQAGRVNANQHVLNAQMQAFHAKQASYAVSNQQRFNNQMSVIMARRQNMLMYNQLNNRGGLMAFGGKMFRGLSNIYHAIAIVGDLVRTVEDVVGALKDFYVGIAQSGAQLEKLNMSLRANTTSEKNKQDVGNTLRQLAKQPGIGYTEGFQGYNKLRFSGVTENFAMRILDAFSKGNARAGGDKETFGRTIYAISETINKPFAQAQEIFRQLDFLPIRKILMEKYGVSTTEGLKNKGITSEQLILTLTKEFEKIKISGDSFYNMLDNLTDAGEQTRMALGTGFNDAVKNTFGNMYEDWQKLLDTNFFDEIGTILGENLSNNIDRVTGPMPTNYNTKTGQFDNPYDSSLIDITADILVEITKIVDHTATLFAIGRSIFSIAQKLSLGSLPIPVDLLEGKDSEYYVRLRNTMVKRLHKALDTKKPGDIKNIDRNNDRVLENNTASTDSMEDSIKDLGRSLRLNTDAVNKANEIERRILGGGSTGAKGATPVELSGLKTNKTIQKGFEMVINGMNEHIDVILHNTLKYGND